MRMVSWNVNGLRSVLTKGFNEYFKSINADIFCLQEIKLSEGQVDFKPEDYYCYFNYAEKKGYSGTAVFTKIKPENVVYGSDNEGRIIALEFNDYWIVCVYTPNSQEDLKRLDFRIKWDREFKDFVNSLNSKKAVLICGDMNVAHNEIDLKNPKSNTHNAGFTQEERRGFTELLNSGFVDSFRYLYPDKKDTYSWWSYRFKARERNSGWRIDYWLLSNDFISHLKDSVIDSSITGSDHCPVYIDIE